MPTVNIHSIPAVRIRRDFYSLLDEILPKINFWCNELAELDTLEEQFEYVCALTHDPNIAKDIFLLAKQFEKRNTDTPFQLALLWIYLTGKALEKNPQTLDWNITKAVQALEGQYEIGWSLWKSIKKGASAVYKGAKAVVETTYKGAKVLFEGAKKGISKVLNLTKDGVFWAIKQVFGSKIGGFITNTIELITGSAAKMTFGFMWKVIKSLAALIRGKWKEAVNLLLQGVNETLMAPILAPLAAALKLKASTFKKVLARAARKNKMLALQIVSLLFSGISANVQALITQAITIMRPIIIALVSELKGSRSTLKAVDVGLTVILMIVQGVGTFDQIMDSIAAKLRITSARARSLLKSNFRNAMRAISKFNIKDFIKYLLKAVSAPGMDQMKRAITTPSVTRLLDMKPDDVQRFMVLSLKDKKGAIAINQALQKSSPQVIQTVIQQAALRNPKIVTDIIRGSRAQGQILEALSQAA